MIVLPVTLAGLGHMPSLQQGAYALIWWGNGADPRWTAHMNEGLNMISREAKTVWDGDLAHGSGYVSGMSGALDKLPVTFKSRIGSPDGRTSPEELIAAAHSSCFSMALADLLTREGHSPAHLDVTADVTLDDTSGVPTITTSALKVIGRVDGLDATALQEVADRAGAACPVSRALASVNITVEATIQ
jgi:osmotically inducible protein OsmC